MKRVVAMVLACAVAVGPAGPVASGQWVSCSCPPACLPCEPSTPPCAVVVPACAESGGNARPTPASPPQTEPPVAVDRPVIEQAPAANPPAAEAPQVEEPLPTPVPSIAAPPVAEAPAPTDAPVNENATPPAATEAPFETPTFQAPAEAPAGDRYAPAGGTAPAVTPPGESASTLPDVFDSLDAPGEAPQEEPAQTAPSPDVPPPDGGPAEDELFETGASESPEPNESWADGSTRTWHDASGRHACVAKLIEATDAGVLLLRDDGATVRVPYQQLGGDDLLFVRDQIETQLDQRARSQDALALAPSR